MWATLRGLIDEPHKRRGPGMIILWLAWLLVGSLFYAYAPRSNLGSGKGFYMAVNIGYSIGFGYPAESYDPYLWFSTVYVLIGSSFVAVALGLFADKVGEDHDNWFINMVQAKAYRDTIENSTSFFVLSKAIYVQYEAPIRSVGVWLICVGIMITYSIWGLEWPFIQALYFAISTLSTGGHWGLTEGAAGWMWWLTGVFSMVGVPLMGVAMAQLATLLVDESDLEVTKESIVEDVTGEELLMLRKFELENGDGVIDKAEFIILCMVRMGQDPLLIEFISKRFDELDDDDSGCLTIEEITGGKYYLGRDGNICSKSGGTLGVRGLKQFSQAHLNVEFSDSSDEDDNKKEKVSNQA